jgi:hypothetical protein
MLYVPEFIVTDLKWPFNKKGHFFSNWHKNILTFEIGLCILIGPEAKRDFSSKKIELKSIFT